MLAPTCEQMIKRSQLSELKAGLVWSGTFPLTFLMLCIIESQCKIPTTAVMQQKAMHAVLGMSNQQASSELQALTFSSIKVFPALPLYCSAAPPQPTCGLHTMSMFANASLPGMLPQRCV